MVGILSVVLLKIGRKKKKGLKIIAGEETAEGN